MKHKVLLLLLLAAGSTVLPSQAAYLDTVLADQPVGYWRLDEAAGSSEVANAGSLGTAGKGTLFNNVTLGVPGAVNGESGTAANLDGVRAKVEVPFSAQLNTSSFTIEAWARVTADSTGYRSPVASRDDFPQRGFIFYADPANQWQFWTGTGEQVGWNTVGSAPVEPEAWAHLVGVVDAGIKLFYVNGVLVDGNQSLFSPNGSRVLRIGGSANESPIGDFFFVGDVDEVAVYNKALTGDRVLAHFVAGAGANPSADFSPTIIIQPAPADRFKGESTTLIAVATGSLPLTYQWKKGDVAIAGAIGSTLTLQNLQPSASGIYSVDITNPAGNVTSQEALLTVSDASQPVITLQPQPRTVLPGNAATFTVEATGSTTFLYQWQFNGAILLNQTNATLTLLNVQAANLGAYRVQVRNAAGSIFSDSATLKFPAVPTLSYTDTVKQDNPAGYWRLGESEGETVARDSVGGNDGAYLSEVTLGRPGAPLGDRDTAAGFTPALGTKVDVPWVETLNTPTFTMECWARVAAGSGNYRSPLTSRADSPQRGFIFYADPNNNWQFWTGTGAQVGWTALPGPSVQANAYAHLVGLYDGVRLSFYVNGALVAQRASPYAPNDVNPLRMGGGATEGAGDFLFAGDVDEVAIYSTALSEERILAHYVAGSPLTTPPTIVSQPQPQIGLPGGAVRFSVGATGGQPLKYQWRFNGQDLSNATANTLDLANITSANVGTYTVVVSNGGGVVTSTEATLRIPATPTQLYVDLVKADGPAGYWRLGEVEGETAKDELGANDGTYLNAVALGLAGALPSDTDTAARFSRTDRQKVDVAWSEALNPPQFTVELWAKVIGNVADYRSPLTSRADGPQRGYIFYAEPGNTWEFWSGKGDSSGWDSIPGPRVNADRWTYLAATYDGSTKRFYVDGIEVGTSTAGFAPNDRNLLRFGGGATEGAGTYFFEGDVDEVAVYDRPLNQEQIILHFLAGVATPKAPVISISRVTGRATVNWDAGVLESATTLSGPWTPLANATSPLQLPADQAAVFFRARK